MYRLLALLCLLLPVVLQAAVFKCIGPQGQHVYQDHPCPADHVAHRLQGSYFSLISREPYQLKAATPPSASQVQQEQRLLRQQRKAQQSRQRQQLQALKNCQRLQRRQHALQAQLARSRSAQQTQRLQAQLASLQLALQHAACIP